MSTTEGHILRVGEANGTKLLMSKKFKFITLTSDITLQSCSKSKCTSKTIIRKLAQSETKEVFQILIQQQKGMKLWVHDYQKQNLQEVLCQPHHVCQKKMHLDDCCLIGQVLGFWMKLNQHHTGEGEEEPYL